MSIGVFIFLVLFKGPFLKRHYGCSFPVTCRRKYLILSSYNLLSLSKYFLSFRSKDCVVDMKIVGDQPIIWYCDPSQLPGTGDIIDPRVIITIIFLSQFNF